MSGTLLRTVVTQVGPDVADLLAGGVLILFADGAPPELAEVSVLHAIHEPAAETGPGAGATLQIGPIATTLTGVGALAWAKVREMGHVVINFNGNVATDRPGELNAAAVDLDGLGQALQPGVQIVIAA